jgi:hypothetical protein
MSHTTWKREPTLEGGRWPRTDMNMPRTRKRLAFAGYTDNRKPTLDGNGTDCLFNEIRRSYVAWIKRMGRSHVV